jgi:hypothetical protein
MQFRVRGVHFDDRQVGVEVDSGYLAAGLKTGREIDLQVIYTLDNVIVGDNMAFLIVHKTRTQAAISLFGEHPDGHHTGVYLFIEAHQQVLNGSQLGWRRREVGRGGFRQSRLRELHGSRRRGFRSIQGKASGDLAGHQKY